MPISRCARAINGLAAEQDRRAIAPLAIELRRLAERPQDAPAASTKRDDIKQHLEQLSSILLRGLDAKSQLLTAAAALPDPSYLPSLERLLARDGDNEMIRDALAAARNLSPAVGPPPVDSSGDAARLDSADVLGDMKRLRAVQAAASADDLLRGLHAASTQAPHYQAMSVLLRECARRADPVMAEAAARWAQSDDPKRRVTAALALGGRHPTQDPIETLRDMSDDVRAVLRKLVDDPVAEVARAGLDAILSRALGDKDEIKPLSAGRHPDAGVRTAYVGHAYGITEWFDGSADVDALLGFLADPAPAVRTEAATRISHILDSDDHGGAFDRADVRAVLRATARDKASPMLMQSRAISILAKLGDDVSELILLALGKVDTLTAETLDHFLLTDEIQAKPDARYVPGLERYARKVIEAVGADGAGAFDDLIAACRNAR
jgi:hypothetical protein